MKALALRTYPWARRPLLLASLLVLLAALGLAWLSPDIAEQYPTTGQANHLSDAQLKGIEAQSRDFSERMLKMQAEMSAREADATRQRIAAAERTYKEQADRQRAEQEKRAHEQAQRDEQARREQAEREKKQEQIAAAEQAQLQREQAQAEKLTREKAERERTEAEQAAAAERVRQETEQRAAQLAEEKRQHEEDERAAQKIPASQLIAKSDLEAIMGFAVQAPEDREVGDKLTKKELPGVEEASSCFFASTLPKTARSFLGVMLTVRYLREKDEDQAETVVRDTLGKVEFGSPDLFFGRMPELGYAGFFYRDSASVVSDAILVFKPTLRGCTLLRVGIEGAPSEESITNYGLWHQHLLDRERRIALKILGPPRVSVTSYESRHPTEQKEETQSSYLPDIPGVDPKVMRFLNGMSKAAAQADADHVANSKSAVAGSGGRKMLCPKCGGSKKMVQHYYKSGLNPHGWGTLGHALYENGRNSTSIENCDRCGGTGVVDAR
ncbi:MAG: hypothetical protein ABI217_08350 [Chthoniobacterales bacterium]